MSSHSDDVDQRQAAIYQAMTPAQRLSQALGMNQRMRSLMDAALKAEHPDWSEDARRQVIARRILRARTG